MSVLMSQMHLEKGSESGTSLGRLVTVVVPLDAQGHIENLKVQFPSFSVQAEKLQWTRQ